MSPKANDTHDWCFLAEADLHNLCDNASSDNIEKYKAIIQYSRAANMEISTKVRELPRELRDQIYTFLLEQDSAKVPPIHHLLGNWRSLDDLPSFTDLQDEDCEGEIPHFFSYRFVGQQFASEALDCFADNVGKDISGGVELDDGDTCRCENLLVNLAYMDEFVDKDLLGIRKSMEELIRNLDLGFRLDNKFLESNPTKFDNVVSLVNGLPYTDRVITVGNEHEGAGTRPRNIYLYTIFNEEIKKSDEEAVLAEKIRKLKRLLSYAHRICRMMHDKGFEVWSFHTNEGCDDTRVFEPSLDFMSWTTKQDWDDAWASQCPVGRGCLDELAGDGDQAVAEWTHKQIWDAFADVFTGNHDDGDIDVVTGEMERVL